MFCNSFKLQILHDKCLIDIHIILAFGEIGYNFLFKGNNPRSPRSALITEYPDDK